MMSLSRCYCQQKINKYIVNIIDIGHRTINIKDAVTFRKYLLLEPSIDNNNVLILGAESEVPSCTHNC